MLTMSTASQEGPGLAKVYPGLRFFGMRISLTDGLAEPAARLIIHSNSARRASHAAPQIIPTTALPISTVA
jgi:hypothetical protein